MQFGLPRPHDAVKTPGQTRRRPAAGGAGARLSRMSRSMPAERGKFPAGNLGKSRTPEGSARGCPDQRGMVPQVGAGTGRDRPAAGRSHDQNQPGNFFEDFRIGQVISMRPRAPSRPATSRSTTRCSARASRCNRPTLLRANRLSARAGRRSPGLSHRVRQDRAGHLAQRGRQSRLCRLPLPRAGLSGRYPDGGLRGHRLEGELRAARPASSLCARPATTRMAAGARLRALGHGAQARRGGAGAGRPRAALPEAVAPACSATPVRLRTGAYDDALAGSAPGWATIGRASRSTMSTA